MNTPLRVLLVDDEALARLRLRSLLQACTETPNDVVAEAEDATSALRIVNDPPGGAPIDLLLLDIRMPGRDGMQLASALRLLPRPPAVVFVTAHASHALRAFELDAVDYLTKPVQRARLQDALQRAVQWRAARSLPPATAAMPLAAAAPLLVVAERGRVLRIPFDEVLFLKAEMKYVTLRTADRAYVLDDSLAELEQRLAAEGAPGAFLRIHRNAVVALAAVRELRRHAEVDGEEGWAVRMAPIDEWLPVSRRQVAAVREALARSRPAGG
jgi:two-component system, LytTR family, response regulator AlgR